MKYSFVIMALVGAISAEQLSHHHHKHHKTQQLSAVANPAKNRGIFEDHVATADEVVKAQEAFEAKQTAEIQAMHDKATADTLAKRQRIGKKSTHQNAGGYPQHPFPTVQEWASRPQFLAQGEPNVKKGTPEWSYLEKAKSLEAVNAAVAEQERFMAEHNKMVADNFAADDLKAKTLRARVSRARQTQLQGGLDYVALDGEDEIKKGTPAWSYKQKADSLKEVLATVAEQERFMAEHNKMVADNFAADDLKAKTERARVSRARQTQLQGGLDYVGLEEQGPKPGTPAFSYQEKAESLKEVRKAVAEQKRFMAEHNKMVADNFAEDDAAAKAERARVSRARQTQLQGGLDY